MNKKIIAILIIAIIAFTVAIVALGELTLKPTTTPQPTPKPTATPNLSSAKSDMNQYISVNLSYTISQGHPYYRTITSALNVTNISKSNATITTITYVNIANFTEPFYESGNQVLSPNQTATFDLVSDFSAPLFNSITVYYQVSGELFYYTLSNPPAFFNLPV